MTLSPNAKEATRLHHARPLPQALALRYKVYCEEFGYLPAHAYPSGHETDDDDASAAHFHLFTASDSDEMGRARNESIGRSSTSLSGYVRLVRPDSRGMLPVQRRCQLNVSPGMFADPTECAEVSRLILAPEFRRSRRRESEADQSIRVLNRSEAGHPSSTDLLLRLFKQMVNYSRAHGIRYWFAAMERPLARSMAQMGFPFSIAGPEAEFYGRITPYVTDLHDLEHRVAERQPQLAQWFSLARGHEASPVGLASTPGSPIWASRPPPPQVWRAGC